MGFLANRATTHGSTVLGLCLAYRTSAVAPTTKSNRKYLSPILETRPGRSLPLLDLFRVGGPSEAGADQSGMLNPTRPPAAL